MHIEPGKTITARDGAGIVRDWTVRHASEGVDIVIADAHLTEAESKRIRRLDEVNKDRVRMPFEQIFIHGVVRVEDITAIY